MEELLIFRKFRRIQFRIHELTQEHLIIGFLLHGMFERWEGGDTTVGLYLGGAVPALIESSWGEIILDPNTVIPIIMCIYNLSIHPEMEAHHTTLKWRNINGHLELHDK